MGRPKQNYTSIQFYLFKVKRWLARRIPARPWWSNQKVGDAELLAIHLARIHFKHPYSSLWWKLMQSWLGYLPSYPQAYVRLKRLLPILELLLTPKPRSRRFIIVDSEPIPACKWVRRHRCKVVNAFEGYSKHGAFYGFRLHAFVSTRGEILLYCIRSGEQHDYKVAKSLLSLLQPLGNPIRLADKAYQSKDFVAPPKSNAKAPSKWKPHYSQLRKRIETVFSQLVGAHIRVAQFQTKTTLKIRVALTILNHNLKIWKVI